MKGEHALNIYDFFNSRDISEHCQKIGYLPTAQEAAYIIRQSYRHTMEEKHAAWQELIDSYPDERPVFGSNIEEEVYLREFLTSYMKYEREYVKSFIKPQPGFVYTFEQYSPTCGCYLEDSTIFDSYEACAAAIRDRNEKDPQNARIIKNIVCSSSDSSPLRSILILNSDMEIIGLEGDDIPFESHEEVFSDMFFLIPTPFKKGDLLVANSCDRDYLLVLHYIPCFENGGRGDNSGDMDILAYSLNDDGDIFLDNGGSYLDLEYCRRAPKGREKILLALSSYLKGKVNLDDFLSAYDLLRTEDRARKVERFFPFSEEQRRNLGLS